MAGEAQIIYEYTNGNDVSIKTDNLKITLNRLFVKVTTRPDGNIYVDDPGIKQRVFTGTGTISGADASELNTVQTAAITFDGTYPRIKKIYFAGATTIANIPVTAHFILTDLGSEKWNVSFTMTEYSA
jgi:hypothetical protein